MRILEPFFTTKDTGTGLGLWVSGEIIAKHNATLRVASRRAEAGKRSGTVFMLFFPGRRDWVSAPEFTSGRVQRVTVRPLAWREIRSQLDYLEAEAGLDTAERSGRARQQL